MDRRAIAAKLKTLRERTGEGRADFARRIKMGYSHAQNIEEGIGDIQVDTLKRWLEGCNTSLSKFFAELESEAGEGQPIVILAAYERYYQKLNEILRSGNPFYIQGIESNLVGLAFAATTLPSEQRLETDSRQIAGKSERGNVARKEKKRAVG